MKQISAILLLLVLISGCGKNPLFSVLPAKEADPGGSGSGGGSSNGTLVWSENFESSPEGAYNGFGAASQMSVYSGGCGNSKSLKVTISNTATFEPSVNIGKSLVNSTLVYDFCVIDTFYNAGSVPVLGPNTSWTDLYPEIFNNDLIDSQALVAKTIASIKTNTWYNIKITFDTVNKVSYFYLNGVKVDTITCLPDPMINLNLSIGLAGPPGVYCLDNISVYEN